MFDSIVRRPQRLLVLLIAFMAILFITTYASLSSWGSDQLRAQLQHIPAFFSEQAVANTTCNVTGVPTFELANWTSVRSVEDLRPFAHVGDDGNLYPPSFVPQEANTMPRAKAGFIVLVRNSELEGMREAMRDVEDRFNRKYGYPWVFLNDKPFSKEFQEGVQQMTRSETRFGLIPAEHWGYPDWIDQTHAAAQRQKMHKEGIIYGGSESYRHMCRFNSGFFFRHPLTQDLDYYWRVEPGIRLHCDLDYDPFVFMQLNNKVYGFTISLHEYPKTIPTLWEKTKAFMKLHPDYLAKDHALHFMTDEPERLLEPGYNMCHFWSNFEIADLRFWRDKKYMDYFTYLDRDGGVRKHATLLTVQFFYERWGDAPVHSIAAVLFANRSQIHHFDDIGYYHGPWLHCPTNRAKYQNTGRCNCNPNDSSDKEDFMCMKEWWRTSIEGPPK
ncbi:hypothetical protein MSPP1_002806 [Malassezia sp. CBS 17886]|nr:hypothetical protein MSPP1_002806 [Malassezia sp. CBS 17886]